MAKEKSQSSAKERPKGVRWPARGPRLDVEVLDRVAAFAGLDEEWRKLPFDSDRPGISGDARFVRAWSETLGSGVPLAVFAFRLKGELVGVIPMASRRLPPHRGGRRLELVGSSGPSVSDLTSVAVRPGLEVQVAAAFVDHLDAESERWDTLLLGNVAADSQVLAAVNALVAARGWRHAVRTLPGVIVDTDAGDFDAYAKTVDRYKRLKRRWPQLQRMGDARVELELRGEEGAEALEGLIALHRVRWAPNSILDDPAYCDFLRRLYRDFEASDQAILTTMTLDDELLHVTLVFRLGGAEQWLITAANPDERFRAISPGALHESMMIRHAIDSGVSYAHLLRTVLPAKLRWATRLDYELAVRVQSPAASRGVGLGLVANESAVLGGVVSPEAWAGKAAEVARRMAGKARGALNSSARS